LCQLEAVDVALFVKNGETIVVKERELTDEEYTEIDKELDEALPDELFEGSK